MGLGYPPKEPSENGPEKRTVSTQVDSTPDIGVPHVSHDVRTAGLRGSVAAMYLYVR
jgi:hypothetical protein